MNARIRFATLAVAFGVLASACGAGSADLADTPPTVDQTELATDELADVATPQSIVDEPERGPVGGAVDPSLPWLSASEDGVFVAGLTSQTIEDRTGLAPGVIVIEDNPNTPGPTLSFGPGEVGRGAFIVQLNTSTVTFDDIVATQPGATFEDVAGYDLLVVSGLAAFIDFPEGPVQVQSLAFSHENSGLELARLIAESRAAIS